MAKRYKLSELEKLPTLSKGQADDLKIDTGNTRVWLSRLTVEDGMPYNNQVTVEVKKNGHWITSQTHKAK